jgi:hypothetical protein
MVKSTSDGNNFRPVDVSPKMTMPFWQVASAQSGEHVFAAWENKTQNLSGLPDGIDVYFRASSNGGRTFGSIYDLTDDNSLKILLASQNKPLSFVLPQIATSPDGNNVYVGWQESYPDSTEIYFTASTDAGQSFGRIISLNEQAKDPISALIAAGSSNPFVGQIVTPVGLVSSAIGITLVGIIAFTRARRRKTSSQDA